MDLVSTTITANSAMSATTKSAKLAASAPLTAITLRSDILQLKILIRMIFNGDLPNDAFANNLNDYKTADEILADPL